MPNPYQKQRQVTKLRKRKSGQQVEKSLKCPPIAGKSNCRKVVKSQKVAKSQKVKQVAHCKKTRQTIKQSLKSKVLNFTWLQSWLCRKATRSYHGSAGSGKGQARTYQSSSHSIQNKKVEHFAKNMQNVCQKYAPFSPGTMSRTG